MGFNSYDQALKWLQGDTATYECKWNNRDALSSSDVWMKSTDSATAGLEYSVEVFPNACQDAP
jgi:hypothetical protein